MPSDFGKKVREIGRIPTSFRFMKPFSGNHEGFFQRMEA
jgi:hypothetical protein